MLRDLVSLKMRTKRGTPVSGFLMHVRTVLGEYLAIYDHGGSSQRFQRLADKLGA